MGRQGRAYSRWSCPRGCAIVLVALGAVLAMPAPSSIAAEAICPNQSLRLGPSAFLPDCRAYELVTPSAAESRTIFFFGLRSESNNFFPTDMATESGDDLIYGIGGGSLPEFSGGTGVVDVFEATRTKTEGWKTVRRLSPSGAQAEFPNTGGVSLDHQYNFTNVLNAEGSSGSLLEGLEPAGEGNYLHKLDGSYEFVGVGSLGQDPRAEGRFISAHGRHIIFTTGNGPTPPLEENSPPAGTAAVYDRGFDEFGVRGPTHVVSLLPGEIPLDTGENATYDGNSSDGAVVAFTVGSTMYVRVDDAETKEVIDDASAAFAGMSAHGEYMFYVTGGNAYRFTTASGVTTQVTHTGDAKLVNVSADGSHAYFISQTVIGGEGTAGKPNLYMWEAGTETIHFVDTVSPSDLAAGSPPGSPSLDSWLKVVAPAVDASAGPGAGTSRSTPTGEVLAFISHAELTAYENSNHAEVYRYDSRNVAKPLTCVSCNPSGASATFGARLEPEGSIMKPVSVVHNLSEDGGRVFFETKEALVPRDIDGINDIYEWTAGGASPTIALISSGRTPVYPEPSGAIPESNVLAAITPSGGDVFFRTREPLTGAGGDGANFIYDARVNGGFPESLIRPCAGEGCQPASAGRSFGDAASATYAGRGNFTRPKRCRNGKRNGKKGTCRPGKHSQGARHKKQRVQQPTTGAGK